jgi:CubicO group peptidase (beta-lactamase class C family)
MKPRAILIALGVGLCVLGAGFGVRVWQHRSGPRVVVDGGDAGGLPRSSPESEHLDAEGLERAAHDAAADGLEAFVVIHNEHIVFERYGHGFDAKTVVDSGGFAQALVALLAGTALQEGVLSPQAINGFDANRLRAAIEAGAQQPYAAYLSHKLWRRLNAAPAWIELPAKDAAAPAECCFHAQVLDWLRVAGLLLDDGRFEGTQVTPRGWVERMMRPVSSDGQHGFGIELGAPVTAPSHFVVPGVLWLHGPGRWRLWLVPQLKLAILFGADMPRNTAPSSAWDETRLPNLVIGMLAGVPVAPPDPSMLQRLVPGH